MIEDLEKKIAKLERENRILKKKLERSENNQVNLEDAKDRFDKIYRSVIKELDGQKKFLQDIFDFLPDSTMVIDEDGQVIAWNKAMEQLTGVAADDMLGKKNNAYSIPFYGEPRPILIDLARKWDDSAKDQYITLSKKADGTLISESFYPKLKDGTYISASARQLFDTSGNPKGAIESLRDVTEKRLIEQENLASQRKMQAMSRAVDDALIMINSKGEILFWNPSAEKMFGYSEKEALGQDIHGLIAASQTKQIVHDGMKQFGQTGEGKVINAVRQTEAVNREGEIFPVEVTTAAFQIDDEWFAVGTVRDITARVRAERRLRFTQYAMDHAFHSVFWVDPSTGKFIYVNEAACKSLGYTREELLGMVVPQIDVDFPADKLGQFIQALRDHDFIPTQGRHLTKSGKFLDVELTCYLSDYIESEVIVVFALDITERLKAQLERDEAFQVISSSIEYASRIQRSVLPPVELLDKMVKDYFVLWEPRDVVGGDIYWCLEWGQGVLVILADCTGHGVPGAFMTLISSGALERGILDVPVGDPAALIQRMHQLIQIVLGQDSNAGQSDDGLEMGMCYIHPDKNRITFAGAGFPLFKLNGKNVEIIKGKKIGIAYRHIDFDSTWINQEIEVSDGDLFYMSSDGIFDQIGGDKRMGFGKKRFKNLLASIQDVPMTQQGKKIYEELEKYQGSEKRRDDVSAIGFTIRSKKIPDQSLFLKES